MFGPLSFLLIKLFLYSEIIASAISGSSQMPP